MRACKNYFPSVTNENPVSFQTRHSACCYALQLNVYVPEPLSKRSPERERIPAGSCDIVRCRPAADYAENSDAYYLVEKKGRQTLVRISEEFLMSQDLADTVDPKKFMIADNVFAKAVNQLI